MPFCIWYGAHSFELYSAGVMRLRDYRWDLKPCTALSRANYGISIPLRCFMSFGLWAKCYGRRNYNFPMIERSLRHLRTRAWLSNGFPCASTTRVRISNGFRCPNTARYTRISIGSVLGQSDGPDRLLTLC